MNRTLFRGVPVKVCRDCERNGSYQGRPGEDVCHGDNRPDAAGVFLGILLWSVLLYLIPDLCIHRFKLMLRILKRPGEEREEQPGEFLTMDKQGYSFGLLPDFKPVFTVEKPRYMEITLST